MNIKDNYTLLDFFDISNLINGFEEQEYGEVNEVNQDKSNLNVIGCCFPNYCCMEREHFKYECYTGMPFQA